MEKNRQAALGGLIGLLLVAVVVIAMGVPALTLFPMAVAGVLLLWAYRHPADSSRIR